MMETQEKKEAELERKAVAEEGVDDVEDKYLKTAGGRSLENNRPSLNGLQFEEPEALPILRWSQQ